MSPSSVFILLSGARNEGVQREQVGGRGWNQILVSLVSWARWFLFCRPSTVGRTPNFCLYRGSRTTSRA